MNEEKRYLVVFMQPERLEVRRDHAQRYPWGRTAELVGHIDAQQSRIAALEACLRSVMWSIDKGAINDALMMASIHGMVMPDAKTVKALADARALLAGKEGDNEAK